jgi:hypothetical protein
MPWAQGVAGSNPVAPTNNSHQDNRDAGKPVRLKKSPERLNLQAVPGYPV